MTRPANPKRICTMLLIAYTVLPFLLWFVASNAKRNQTGTAGIPAPVLYAICAGTLATSIFSSFRNLRAGMPVRVFQVNLILCLALSELSAILGFVFVGQHSASAYLPFGAATIAANVLFIAPRLSLMSEA